MVCLLCTWFFPLVDDRLPLTAKWRGAVVPGGGIFSSASPKHSLSHSRRRLLTVEMLCPILQTCAAARQRDGDSNVDDNVGNHGNEVEEHEVCNGLEEKVHEEKKKTNSIEVGVSIDDVVAADVVL